MSSNQTIFSSTPHPDERIEWLRAQVEAYLQTYQDQLSKRSWDALVMFVYHMEAKFQPKGLLDR